MATDTHNANNRGRIEVISGCMFAGKTSQLIDKLEAATAAGRRVGAFKHSDDVRYADTALATHDRREFPARTIDTAAALEEQAGDAEVIGLDEAHFFGPALTAVCERLRADGRTVILVGLDHDMWGQSLPPLEKLKRIADNVQIMLSPCSVCGEPAIYSQRMTPIIDGNIVGGVAEYEVRCEACFVPLDSPPPVYETE